MFQVDCQLNSQSTVVWLHPTDAGSQLLQLTAILNIRPLSPSKSTDWDVDGVYILLILSTRELHLQWNQLQLKLHCPQSG